MKKPLVAICIPIWDSVSGYFFSKFLELSNELFRNAFSKDGRYDFRVLCSQHQFICQARNDLVERALNIGATHILFLDSDSIIEPYFITKMLEDDKDVITAITFGKNPPHKPVVFRKEEDWFQCIVDIDFYKGLIEIDGVGFGCTMIRSNVFREIGKPYFTLEVETVDSVDIYQGEDLVFSDRIREKGFKLYADTDLIYSHYGGTIGLNNYQVYREDIIVLEKEKQEIIEDLMDYYGYSKKEVLNKLIILPSELPHSDGNLFEQVDWYITKYRSICYEIIDKIDKECSKYGDLRILDLDKKLGQIGYLLAQRGYNIYVIIFTPKPEPFFIFRALKRNINLNFFTDFEKIPNDYFHFIIANDIFEHLDDKEFEYYLKQIKRIMVKGGRLLSKTIEHDNRHSGHFEWTMKRQELAKKILQDKKRRISKDEIYK